MSLPAFVLTCAQNCDHLIKEERQSLSQFGRRLHRDVMGADSLTYAGEDLLAIRDQEFVKHRDRSLPNELD
jgi:hypothetical protein